MFVDLLIVFIIVLFIFLILSVFLMESDNPLLAAPFIIMGWIFSVVCTYGLWNIEIYYTAVNTTTGGTDLLTHQINYGDPYGYIFYFLFFVFVIFFVRMGFNQVRLANEDNLVE